MVFFADEQCTREFIEWGFGSFQKVRWHEIPFFLAVIGLGATIAVLATKDLNAQSMGSTSSALG